MQTQTENRVQIVLLLMDLCPFASHPRRYLLIMILTLLHPHGQTHHPRNNASNAEDVVKGTSGRFRRLTPLQPTKTPSLLHLMVGEKMMHMPRRVFASTSTCLIGRMQWVQGGSKRSPRL